MGNIYKKLGLLDLAPKERAATIFEIYCPLLKNRPTAPIPEEGDDEPEPITPEVQRIVEEDENALVLWESGQIIEGEVEEIPPRPRRRAGCIWGVLGILVGLGLLAGYLIFFGGGIPGVGGQDSPPPQVEESTKEPPDVLETPLPVSDTPVEIVITETPLPASETSLPSDTPVPPTATTAPTATPEADTQPGSILEVGEWWKEEGVWLRLAEYRLTQDIPSIRIRLELWNKIGDTLLFSWNTSGNLSLRDNNGFNYPLTLQFTNITENAIFEPDEIGNVRITNLGNDVVFQDDRLFDADVTELILTVTELSRIDRAQFRITLNK
jgi:hypothetical protein